MRHLRDARCSTGADPGHLRYRLRGIEFSRSARLPTAGSPSMSSHRAADAGKAATARVPRCSRVARRGDCRGPGGSARPRAAPGPSTAHGPARCRLPGVLEDLVRVERQPGVQQPLGLRRSSRPGSGRCPPAPGHIGRPVGQGTAERIARPGVAGPPPIAIPVAAACGRATGRRYSAGPLSPRSRWFEFGLVQVGRPEPVHLQGQPVVLVGLADPAHPVASRGRGRAGIARAGRRRRPRRSPG